MKTTIEIDGFKIKIDQSEEGSITVSAEKDEEVIEEFTLETSEDEEDGEMIPFGEDQEEIESDEEEIEEDEEEIESDEEEIEEDEEEVHQDETKLESFSSFIGKKK